MMNHLRFYFSVPSAKNFSPYKTGQNIHFMFSSLAAVMVVWVCSKLFTLTGAAEGIIVFGSVLLLWGAGAAVDNEGIGHGRAFGINLGGRRS